MDTDKVVNEVVASIREIMVAEGPLDWGTNWSYFVYHAFGIIAICVLLFMFCVQLRRKFDLNKLILWGALVTWLSGAAIYSIGFTYTVESYQIATNSGFFNRFLETLSIVPSAIISSLGMFVFSDDLSDINPVFINDLYYMTAFSVCHFAAAFFSSLLAVQLVGRRLIDYLSLLLARIKYDGNRPLYVFWGINQPSLSLAKSVVKDDPLIVFVNIAHEDEEKTEYSIADLFGAIKMRRQERKDILEIDNTYITNCSSYLEKNEDLAAKVDIIGKELKLGELSRLIKKASEIRMFFIGNDENENINRCIALSSDAQLCGKKIIHFYCHASRESAKAGWMDHYEWMEKNDHLRMHVVDSAYLSVAQLKLDKSAHPVNYVTVSKDSATVDEPFNCLVVGYGETGKEAVKFLYEFGSFVDANGDKTPFHCTVIDQDADARKGLYYAQCPDMEGRGEIEFVNCAVDSEWYWQEVKRLASQLNYIVVAVGDDELSLNTASRLCERLYHWRESKRELPVYVRIINTDNWAIGVVRGYVEDRFASNESKEIRLIPFGSVNEIFSQAGVIEDAIINMAKEYNYEYNGYNVEDIEQAWKLELTRKMRSPYRLCDLEEICRKRDQNVSNALHAFTKKRLLESALGPIADDVLGIMQKKVQTIIHEMDPHEGQGLPVTDKERIVILNVAKCEHERWVSSMRMAGNRPPQAGEDAGCKDTRKKVHCDMVPWNQIRCWEEKEQMSTQSYDVKVVKVSLKPSN